MGVLLLERKSREEAHLHNELGLSNAYVGGGGSFELLYTAIFMCFFFTTQWLHVNYPALILSKISGVSLIYKKNSRVLVCLFKSVLLEDLLNDFIL